MFIALAAVLAVGLALRVPFLQEKTFFIDEAYSWMLASGGAKDILAGAASESNPPLPMFAFHLWQSWARDEWQLRLLCLILNLAAVPVLYLFGERLGGRSAGLAAAALGAVSAYQVEFSQIYRYPAMAALIGAVCYCFLWRWIESRNSKFLPPLAAAFIIGLYTHYFFIFLVLAANVFVFVCFIRDWKTIARWAASQAIVAAAFTPWLFAFVKQSGSELAVVRPDTLAAHLKTLPFFAVPNVLQAFSFGSYPVREHLFFMGAGVLVYAALFARLLLLRDPLKKWFLITNLGLALVLPYFMMLFLGLRLQLLYFCVFSSLLYASFAVSLSAGKNAAVNVLLGTALFALIAVSLVFYYSNVRDPENNKTVIRYIESNAGARDIVVVNPTYQSSLFEYYRRKPLHLFGIPRQFDIRKYSFTDTAQVTPERLAEMDRSVPPGARVWLFCGFGVRTKPDQKAMTFEFLKSNYRLVREKRFAPATFARGAGILAVFEKPE